MKNFVFEIPRFSEAIKYEKEILSEHIAYEHPKIYEIPVEIH